MIRSSLSGSAMTASTLERRDISPSLFVSNRDAVLFKKLIGHVATHRIVGALLERIEFRFALDDRFAVYDEPLLGLGRAAYALREKVRLAAFRQEMDLN